MIIEILLPADNIPPRILVLYQHSHQLYSSLHIHNLDVKNAAATLQTLAFASLIGLSITYEVMLTAVS